MVIKFWSKGDPRYSFLSNFYERPIRGLHPDAESSTQEWPTWPSAENYYQACKLHGNVLMSSAYMDELKTCSPWRAKQIGKDIPIVSEEWNVQRVRVMEHILRRKFSDDALMGHLLLTGTEELVHWAPWDRFWGTGKDGNGQNMMGKILMDIRKGLKPEGEKMQLTTVANKYHLPAGWENDPKFVNIMRPSKWGNPHKVGYCEKCKVNHPRGEAVKKFAEDFNTGEGYDLDELTGKILVCCCKPQDCHGDILAYYANGVKNAEEKKMEKHKVFVFGSNLKGIHGAGQALTAKDKWGAKCGVGEGRTGDAYAIPTKIVPTRDTRQLPLEKIQESVDRFISYATLHQDLLEFMVPRIGCGLAGYTDDEIGPMFKGAPENVKFMEEPGFESWEKWRSERKLVICGTGHRPDKLGGFSDEVFEKGVALARAIIQARKPSLIISGGALGWDQMLAAGAIHEGVELHLYAPCYNQEKPWPKQSQDLYHEIFQHATLKKYIHEGPYNASCMDDRNKAMVDASQEVWALWNGDRKGGTFNCIEYAKRQKGQKDFGRPDLKILNFWKNW